MASRILFACVYASAYYCFVFTKLFSKSVKIPSIKNRYHLNSFYLFCCGALYHFEHFGWRKKRDLKSSARKNKTTKTKKQKMADDGESIRLLLPPNNLIDGLEMPPKTPKESAVCSSQALVSHQSLLAASHLASHDARLLIREKNKLQAVKHGSLQ